MACNKTIVCQVCGKETPLTRRGGLQKYCPECRKIVKRERYSKKYLGDAELREFAYVKDSDEMMAMCLSCKLPRCTGECIKVADLKKKEKKLRATRRKEAANGA